MGALWPSRAAVLFLAALLEGLVLLALHGCHRTLSGDVHGAFTYRPGMTAREVLAESPGSCRVDHPNERTTVIDCGPFFPGAYMPHSCEGDCGSGTLTIQAEAPQASSLVNTVPGNIVLAFSGSVPDAGHAIWMDGIAPTASNYNLLEGPDTISYRYQASAPDRDDGDEHRYRKTTCTQACASTSAREGERDWHDRVSTPLEAVAWVTRGIACCDACVGARPRWGAPLVLDGGTLNATGSGSITIESAGDDAHGAITFIVKHAPAPVQRVIQKNGTVCLYVQGMQVGCGSPSLLHGAAVKFNDGSTVTLP